MIDASKSDCDIPSTARCGAIVSSYVY